MLFFLSLSLPPLDGCPEDGKESSLLHLGTPDDVDISIELKDWLFALEGTQEMADRLDFHDPEVPQREERSWHMTFQNIHVKAKSTPKHAAIGKAKRSGKQKYPIELITVRTDFSFFFPTYQYLQLLCSIVSVSHSCSYICLPYPFSLMVCFF